tara:strand:- start:454 stop:831 length:378 start_codon:yes stop_codon:yes gene_type:complete
MANSLEVRVPFLDHNLVEYVLNIKDNQKLNGYPKALLIKAFEDLIPEEIYKRKKQGFNIPIQLWMKNELKEMCTESLENIYDSKYFNSDLIKKMWNQYLLYGKNWFNIWSLVVISRWAKNNQIDL